MRPTRLLLCLPLVLLALPVPGAARVAETAEDIRPLLPGTEAPTGTLRQLDGTSVELADLVDGQPTLLVFYRGGWCPYCTLQLSSLRNLIPDLEDLGVQLLAVSADRPERLVQSVEKGDLGYRLLSDSTAELMKAYGIAFRVDEKTVTAYREYGIDLAAASGEDHGLLPVPAVFVIDAEGTIQFSYANPDYTTRLPESVLRPVLQATSAKELGQPLM